MEIEYEIYIHSREWREKADAALVRAGHRCERCGADRWFVRLEVHHVTYVRLGCERPEDLEVLCHDCHRRHHDALRRGSLRPHRQVPG